MVGRREAHIMLTDDGKKEIERSFQMNTACAFIGLLVLVASLGFMVLLAAQNISAGRRLLELSSAPLGYALFGLFLWSLAKRRLKALAEIRKKSEPNPEGPASP
jgi:NADH:ubiquinone oxidoreductase subunit 6 (subunit J)